MSTMTSAEQIFSKLAGLANSHDAEAFQGHLSEELEFYNPIQGWTVKQRMYEMHTTLFKAFPDIYYDVSRLISSDDTVVAECTLTGTHEGDLMGMAPTQRRLELPATFIVDVERDKVKRWASYFDVASMMRQLGAQE